MGSKKLSTEADCSTYIRQDRLSRVALNTAGTDVGQWARHKRVALTRSGAHRARLCRRVFSEKGKQTFAF